MAEETIKISGKCDTDDIDSCVFRIRKVGATVRAQGQKELADAIEGYVGRISKARVREDKPAQVELEDPGRPLPKTIDVFSNTIEKHYVHKEDCQAKTFRVLKPDEGVLVYMCCAKGNSVKAGRCHPNPTIHKTIVPRTAKYEKELEKLQRLHSEIPVKYHKERVGVEARDSLTVTEPVEGEKHSVSIPLTCTGASSASIELVNALAESEAIE